ncbi:hypothetical protein [Caudoviricetes sp.]|nr:hypothetical protein [Caudoviricetes sp.]
MFMFCRLPILYHTYPYKIKTYPQLTHKKFDITEHICYTEF